MLNSLSMFKFKLWEKVPGKPSLQVIRMVPWSLTMFHSHSMYSFVSIQGWRARIRLHTTFCTATLWLGVNTISQLNQQKVRALLRLLLRPTNMTNNARSHKNRVCGLYCLYVLNMVTGALPSAEWAFQLTILKYVEPVARQESLAIFFWSFWNCCSNMELGVAAFRTIYCKNTK